MIGHSFIQFGTTLGELDVLVSILCDVFHKFGRNRLKLLQFFRCWRVGITAVVLSVGVRDS